VLRGGDILFKKVHVFRVKPGQELLGSIAHYCREHALTSGVIISIIGSVEKARLNFLKRLPGEYESVDYPGPLEIVCAQGSVALKDDSPIIHIHIQLSGQDICRGGHLAEATVFSTAEVAIAELDYQLRRQLNSYTGLNELLD
jgi:predicted DNA-binding protein with PD1-like motif